MEDSVTENEKLQVLRSSIDYEDEKQGAAKEVVIKGTAEDVVEDKAPPAVGFINRLISNFTPAQGGKEQDEGEKQDRSEHVEDKEQDEEEKEIKVSVESEEEKRGGGGGGGGVLSHIMSNLVSSSPRARVDEGKAGDVDNAKTQEKQGNGTIVSNLPPPLPDEHDAAPASDEASILIHSIIHD